MEMSKQEGVVILPLFSKTSLTVYPAGEGRAWVGGWGWWDRRGLSGSLLDVDEVTDRNNSQEVSD